MRGTRVFANIIAPVWYASFFTRADLDRIQDYYSDSSIEVINSALFDDILKTVLGGRCFREENNSIPWRSTLNYNYEKITDANFFKVQNKHKGKTNFSAFELNFHALKIKRIIILLILFTNISGSRNKKKQTLYRKNNYLIPSVKKELTLIYSIQQVQKLEKLATPFPIDHDIFDYLHHVHVCHYLEHGWNTSYTLVYKFETAVRGNRTTLYINRRRHYDVRAYEQSVRVSTFSRAAKVTVNRPRDT